ncbi:hypothetical protein [Pseudoroseomonas sp. WGS1072]
MTKAGAPGAAAARRAWMKSILLWFLGIPIPIIILLWIFGVL